MHNTTESNKQYHHYDPLWNVPSGKENMAVIDPTSTGPTVAQRQPKIIVTNLPKRAIANTPVIRK